MSLDLAVRPKARITSGGGFHPVLSIGRVADTATRRRGAVGARHDRGRPIHRSGAHGHRDATGDTQGCGFRAIRIKAGQPRAPHDPAKGGSLWLRTRVYDPKVQGMARFHELTELA
jgi:hypothetical protein